MELYELIAAVHPLPEASARRLAACMTERRYPRGHRVLEAGRVAASLFFVAEGIARAYLPAKGRKITFWIGAEGSVLVSLRSYVCGEPGYETVELLEDAVLFELRRSDLEPLLCEDIHIANWARRFAEREFLRTEERFMPLLFTTAARRYEELLERRPELLRRVPLESLASYLGITPVSLSRIRARIGRRKG